VQFHIGNYTLGANYCRHSLKKGGLCFFFHNSLRFVGTDLQKISIDQDIEACAIRLLYSSCNIYILTIYRAPTGNFTCFIKKLEAILCSLCTLNMHLIICGDINVNYLVHNSRRKIWMLYYPCLIYPALFIFLLHFRTHQQQQLTIFLLILLNFQIM
jgi:hypothetical protein